MKNCTVAASTCATLEKKPSAKKTPPRAAAPAADETPALNSQPNDDEKLVAETVATQLRAAYDQHYRGLHVNTSCLLTTAIDELDAVLEDRKSEEAIHLAASLINGCIHIERAADVDSLIAAVLEAQYALLESASISYGFGQGGCEALATGIRAGVKLHRDPPQPPASGAHPAQMDLLATQYRIVLESVATHAKSLNELLLIALKKGDGFDSEAALGGAESISKLIGALADSANDGAVGGDLIDWVCGPSFRAEARGGAQ